MPVSILGWSGVPGNLRDVEFSHRSAVREAYEAGEQLQALAARFRLHEQTVKAHLRRAGVELRPSPSLSDEQIAEAGWLYDEGWTIVQVAFAFRV
jgi:hypothetical protein